MVPPEKLAPWYVKLVTPAPVMPDSAPVPSKSMVFVTEDAEGVVSIVPSRGLFAHDVGAGRQAGETELARLVHGSVRVVGFGHRAEIARDEGAAIVGVDVDDDARHAGLAAVLHAVAVDVVEDHTLDRAKDCRWRGLEGSVEHGRKTGVR